MTKNFFMAIFSNTENEIFSDIDSNTIKKFEKSLETETSHPDEQVWCYKLLLIGMNS